MAQPTKTRTLTEATSMGARPIIHVDVEWRDETGRLRNFRHTFHNKAEAESWIKWG